jgi:protein SCO1/2
MKLLLTIALASATLFAAEPVKNVALVNQDGKPFQLYDYKGKYVLLTFVYSRCPIAKMCPLTMTLAKRLVTKWKEAKMPVPLQVVAVTLDPAFDTPPMLKDFGKRHHVDFAHFTLATGNPQVLADLGAAFNIISYPEEGMIAHNMKDILIGPDMVEIKQYKDNEWKPEDVLKDLKAAKPKS